MANVSRTKVITGKETRLSYFHGWEPTSINGGPERYSVWQCTVSIISSTIALYSAASG